MQGYTQTSRQSSRTTFARSAVETEFRARDLRLAAEPGFVDRPPHQQPIRLGEIAVGVVREAAQNAVRHWLHKAAIAQVESEQVAALSIARSVSLKAGLDWPEDREQAA